MAAISCNKEDLSVDNVHTPFGRTKQRQRRLHDIIREPKTTNSIEGFRSHVALSSPTHEEV
ncbi:hypothetical protein StoSoilB20_20080 [Arthrobacter sp. StoSoilB20]|nr:hypothetical protein StoSoilB20_20080 [Arthrobacter sp. StoSoilB20]